MKVALAALPRHSECSLPALVQAGVCVAALATLLLLSP